MRLLKKLDFPDMNFSLYFLGYTKASSIPTDEVERTRWTFSQPATLELTHNWGTEIQNHVVLAILVSQYQMSRLPVIGSRRRGWSLS